jgi:D-alanyl-D-alanine endopeptidase (penicillin-binding protein 7)
MKIALLLAVLCATARAEPRLESPSVIAIDARSGDVLFSRKADEIRPIASMTKLFAALVLRARRIDLSKSTTINYDDALAGVGGAATFLLEGQRFKNSDLLYAMMLSSDNRTPTALARSVGLSGDDLLAAMTKRAADLGLTKTTFVDVTGIGHNTSTAREIALALREAIRDPVLRAYMTTKRARVASETGEVHGDYTSTVPALWSKRTILGGKTGWTEDAGYCQVVAAEIRGRVVVMAFLGARYKAARFDDFVALADWLDSVTSSAPDRAPVQPRPASVSR